MSPRETRRIGAGEERGRQGWLGPSEGKAHQGPRREFELMRMKYMDYMSGGSERAP